MYLLDKYILKKVILGYLFVFLIFTGIHFVIDLFSSLSDILKAKPPLGIVLQYHLAMIPLIFVRVSPFALLISVLHTFGELNKHNEVISVRSAGVSIFRFALPAIFFALFLSFVALLNQEQILIVSQKKVEMAKMQFSSKKKKSYREEKNLAFSSSNMIIFARKFVIKESMLYDVTIFQNGSAGNIEKKIICKRIKYQDQTWQAQDAIEYTFNDQGKIINRPKHHHNLSIGLSEKPHELIFKKSLYAKFAPLKHLRKEITRLKKIHAYNLMSQLTIDYHQKLSEPFSHFFLIIGIIPFALEIKKRRVGLSAIGVGFIFGFIYYWLASFSVALGKADVILPICAAWLAPLFFTTVGTLGLILVK